MMEHCNSSGTSSALLLTVNDLKTITGTLALVLRKAFGPSGQTTLLMSRTGQASMVKDGLETLLCLHLSHPVAKSVQQTAVNLVDTCGDGCKTMVIYLSALLCALDKEINKEFSGCGTSEMKVKNQMAKALNAFLVNDFPPLLSDVKSFINERMKADWEMKSKDFFWIIMHVLSTFLSGCVPPLAVQTIARLILEYLKFDDTSEFDVNESRQWFSSSVTVIPNKLYSSSYVESGVFLQRPLLQNDKMALSSIKMVCMLCSLDGESPATKEGICLLKDPENIVQHRQRRAEKFLAVLRKQNVSLIVCNSTMPAYISHICKANCVTVIDCVEESDIDFICYVTNKSPITSIFEDVTCSSLMDVSSCTQHVVGQSIYAKILFHGNLKWIPRSLFLCAPSDALCKQLKKAVEKGLIVVSHLFSGSDSCMESYSQICFDKGTRLLLNNIVCGGGYFEMVMCQFLCDFCKSERATPMQRLCCRVLVEMLLAPPRVLHDSLSQQRHKQDGWLWAHNVLQERIRNDRVPCGFSSSGQMCNPCDSGVIEVLDVKIGTVYSTISIALCLLNIDEVMCVSKPMLPQ